ncbi:hypothetical protein ABH922_003054 [Rhodococcus sp. 27YEA15]
MSDRVDFICPSLAVTDIELAALGIVPCSPEGDIIYRMRRGVLMAEIGALVVMGSLIRVIPRLECNDRQSALLLGAAEVAFHEQPTRAGGWWPTGDGERWTTYVSVAVPASHPVSMAVRSDRRGDHQNERAA